MNSRDKSYNSSRRLILSERIRKEKEITGRRSYRNRYTHWLLRYTHARSVVADATDLRFTTGIHHSISFSFGRPEQSGIHLGHPTNKQINSPSISHTLHVRAPNVRLTCNKTFVRLGFPMLSKGILCVYTLDARIQDQSLQITFYKSSDTFFWDSLFYSNSIKFHFTLRFATNWLSAMNCPLEIINLVNLSFILYLVNIVYAKLNNLRSALECDAL